MSHKKITAAILGAIFFLGVAATSGYSQVFIAFGGHRHVVRHEPRVRVVTYRTYSTPSYDRYYERSYSDPYYNSSYYDPYYNSSYYDPYYGTSYTESYNNY